MVERGRQQVEREDLTAEQGLCGEREDDEALDLQEPERQQPETKRDGELKECCQNQCGHQEDRAPQFGRQGEVGPNERVDDQQGNEDEGARDNARGEKNGEPVDVVVDRFEQKLVDQPVPDLLADLVVLIERTDHELQGDQGGEIGERLPE